MEIPAVKRPKKRPLPLVIAETLALTAISIVALEAFFAVCGVGGQEFLQPDTELGCRHIPGKQVTWRLEGFSNETLSSAGLRDIDHALQKQPGVTRIALLGDSSTEGLQVSLGETYGRILERQLNADGGRKFEVINFACSSYSTGQQVLQYEKEVLPYKPDITVLLYNRGDSVENIRKPGDYSVEPRPYFYVDGNGQLVQDSAVLEVQKPKLTPHPILEFLRTHSRIYGVFSQANLSLSLHESLYRKLRAPIIRFMETVSGSKSKDAARPVLYQQQDSWTVTSALLERLSADCKQNNSRFILLVFPNTMHDPEFQKQITGMESLSKRLGFDYLDLTQTFLSSKDLGALFLQYHFSAAGHQVTADQLQALVL
jgi:lysophospholipase L1-like esterase